MTNLSVALPAGPRTRQAAHAGPIACVLALLGALACASCGLSGDTEAMLRRGLITHFQAERTEEVTVECELLRLGPTQAGVAAPKYYAWVKVRTRAGILLDEGATRVAQVDDGTFMVLEFLPKEAIRANPAAVRRVFPEVLVPGIEARASKDVHASMISERSSRAAQR